MIQCGKRLAAQSSWMNDAVDFYLVDFGFDGKLRRAVDIKFSQEESSLYEVSRPTFSLLRDCAQELFEQMWAQGFRSANDKGHADRLDAARQEHLADLRRLILSPELSIKAK